MKRILFVLTPPLILCLCPVGAVAQYGYPSGYGGYGWGGWGGNTVQGSIARRLGMFNMGRGVYNLDTAQARAINTDTRMRLGTPRCGRARW